jgi:hypothetical protein
MSSPSSRKRASNVIENMIDLTKHWEGLIDQKCKQWARETTKELSISLRNSYVWESRSESLRVDGINARDQGGLTVGHYAAKFGDLAALQYYFKNGGSVSARSLFGGTIGHEAADHGEVDCLRCYLDHGGDIHAVDDQEDTIAQYACLGKSTACLDIFYNAGGDIFYQNNANYNIGHMSGLNNAPSCLSWYFQHGGSLKIYDNDDSAFLYDSDKSDLGLMSLKYQRDDCLKVFLDHGGDIFHRSIMEKLLSFPETPFEKIARYFLRGEETLSDPDVGQVLVKMISNFHMENPWFHYKCLRPDRFEVLMRQACQTDPEVFNTFLAQCSTEAVDGDDRLLQILCKAMEAP